jgi:hypothetical protein
MTRPFAVLSTILGAAAAVGLCVLVVKLAEAERVDPARCGGGLLAMLARCCADGQKAEGNQCTGHPVSCPAGLHGAEFGPGCVIDSRRVAYTGGTLAGNLDWQSEGIVVPAGATVDAFVLDTSEVTFERWEHCVRAGACRDIPNGEPGVPVTGIEPKDAEKFCRFEGGRLPKSEEWLFAAMGEGGRRFPWGMTGLVCRRASFGLKEGPCAHGGGLELAGSRPDGATPEGVQDLSGNAAEWTTERDGRFVARGGSYLSAAASQLTSFALEVVSGKAPHVGFRCAFTVEKRQPVETAFPR